MAHDDAACRTERNHSGIVEIPVIATEYIGVATFCGLHHVKIVGISQRGVVRVAKYYRLAYVLQELRIVVEFVIGKRI